jgi:hypothetical protein
VRATLVKCAWVPSALQPFFLRFEYSNSMATQHALHHGCNSSDRQVMVMMATWW